ncbi:MAG: hypothetical protein ABL308_12585 [Oceanicaulis sp.]
MTSVFEPSDPVRGLTFLPSGETPWTGLVAAALSDGGFDIFSVEGEAIASAPGPVLNGLAAAPDFPLRGEQFPLLFGADTNGALRGFAVIQQAGEVVELPLEGDEAIESAAGVCRYSAGIGYVEIAVLAEDAEAVVFRIRDTGGDGLTLAETARIALPFAAKTCAAAGDDLIVGDPNAGLARVDMSGETRAFRAGVSVSDVAYSELLGRPSVLAASAETGVLTVFDATTLETATEIVFEEGLNAPAIAQPVALALTGQSYGGMAFSSGLVAVYDRSDSRIKLVAREVVSRAVVSGGETG